MIIYYDNLGQYGIISDTPAHELPQNAWSDGVNVVFTDSAVEKAKGEETVYTTAVAAPYFAMPIIAAGTRFWHYAGLTDIYATNGTTHNCITPTGSTASLSATVALNWTGGALGGGVYILNNGVNAPFQWAGTGLSDAYASLSNWPAGMKARVLRPFKQFLVAGDIDEGSGRDGTLLRWSHPATPGGVPSSWDYTDRTKDAGRVAISQTPDYIVEMEPLRDINMIYKENSIWSMQYIGGNAKFAFRKVLGEVSILSRRCVKTFYGQHLVLSGDDLILHNGNEARSIAQGKWKRWLIDTIDPDNFSTAFMVVDHQRSEVWCCIPTASVGLPFLALVWNWVTNTFTTRNLPVGTAHIEWGIVDTGGDLTFDGDVGTFDEATGTFDEAVDSAALRHLLMCDTSRNRFYRGNTSEQWHGANNPVYVERSALPIGRQDANGIIRPDLSSVKYITEVWPVIEGTPGGVVDVYIGTRDTLESTISWKGPYRYTIGTTRKLDVRVAGKIIDVRFYSNTNITWKLLSYGLNVNIGGAR